MLGFIYIDSSYIIFVLPRSLLFAFYTQFKVKILLISIAGCQIRRVLQVLM